MACCTHDHNTKEENKDFNLKKTIIILAIGIFVYAGALILKLSFWESFSLFFLSYLIIAGDVVWKAIKNILRGEVFDENFLLTVATIGAFAIKEFPEAVAVMLFFKVGELFQDMALNKSRRSIKALLEIRPDYANLKENGSITKVDPDTVKINDIIVVKAGEKVPLDGIILEGTSLIDTSALTGESVPKTVKKADAIYSGTINKTGLLNVQVTKRFGESTVSKILELVENTSSQKAPTEKFITKFAKYYTPAVVYSALLIAVIPVLLYNIPSFRFVFVHQETFSEWIYKALIFLVISCPCALVISIPLGFFGGIGAASKRGILIKGSNYLEALNNIHTIVWDKTGTLTKGVFRVTETVAMNGFQRYDIIKFAVGAECHSNHPIAQSIREIFKEDLYPSVPDLRNPGASSAVEQRSEIANLSGLGIDENTIEGYEEISGYGVKAKIDGHTILVGNDQFLHLENVEHNTCAVQGTVVHVVKDNQYMGYIVISDEIKEDAARAIKRLRLLGINNQIMLTGDSEQVGEMVSGKLNLDQYFSELLPQHKVEKVEELIGKKKNKNALVAFVGDGINDAPVLTRADIGVAMGALGSDAAIEAADIVLMTDEPSRLCEAIQIAKRTRTIVWQNIGFALGVKGAFLILGLLSMTTMWGAVFADVGVALIAILNSMRVLGSARE